MSLMSATEQVSDTTAVTTTGRVGGTGWLRGRTQRGPSARLLRVLPQTPRTTQKPLASVPRRHGNVVCSRVGIGRAEPSLLLVFFWSPLVSSQVRCKTIKHTQVCAGTGGSIPPIVSERGCSELVQVDAGRSLHRARLEGSAT